MWIEPEVVMEKPSRVRNARAISIVCEFWLFPFLSLS